MSDTDYSDRAIAMRIHQVSELRKLCLSLANAKRVTPPDGADRRRSERDPPTDVTTRTA